jgi:hypothetical protein
MHQNQNWITLTWTKTHDSRAVATCVSGIGGDVIWMDMAYDSKETTIRWLAAHAGVLPAKTSPSGKQIPPRPLREGQFIRTRGKLRLGEWGQHGWTDIVRALVDGGFATTLVKVELFDNDLTDEHRSCARSMRVLRVIDATKPIAEWVIGQAERMCDGVDGGLKRVYVDLIENAKGVLARPSDVDPGNFENLHVGIEVLASTHASLLERAIVAAANLTRAACVSFDDAAVAKALREAIIALVKLGDQRLEYPNGFAAMLLALFGDSPASQAPVDGTSSEAVQVSSNAADGERSAEELRQTKSKCSVQNSGARTSVERVDDKNVDEAPNATNPILAEMPDFDRRVLSRLRTEPPKTNVRMLVIAHELGRPEEEVRAAVVRLSRLGVAGFGNRHRREAHATYQPTMSRKPIDEWFQPALARISSAPKISIADLASALRMEREDALQICVLLEQRGLIRLSGPGKSMAEIVSVDARVVARKSVKKATISSPTMTSKPGDEFTRRTEGTAEAERILAVRPTSPPTRRVHHADY